MALKRTSEPFIISTTIAESAANTFTQTPVQVNLNPLDQEVLLILAVDIDCFAPDVVLGLNTAQTVSVSTTTQIGVLSIDSSSCIASQRIDVKSTAASSVMFERSQSQAPTSSFLQYTSILATNNFFLQTEGINNAGAKGGNVRIWCVRARADSSTYAALVQSELLST